MTVLVAGVAQLYQGDLDVGRHAVERMAAEESAPGVLVEELSYGAVAVAQRLEDVGPAALVLMGAAERGRAPGTVERRRFEDPGLSTEELQRAIGDAVTGYVTIDLVTEVAWALGALPPHTVAIEVEPVRIEPSDRLTPEVAAALDRMIALARAEVHAIEANGGGSSMSEQERPLDDVRQEPGQSSEPESEPLRRTTEQGDELTEAHSIAQRRHRAKAPYRPPRQPSQAPPDGEGT